jgi:hypothetical protein
MPFFMYRHIATAKLMHASDTTMCRNCGHLLVSTEPYAASVDCLSLTAQYYLTQRGGNKVTAQLLWPEQLHLRQCKQSTVIPCPSQGAQGGSP